MAATVNVLETLVLGNRYGKIVEVTADTSYPAGGYPIGIESFGFAVSVDLVIPGPASDGTKLYIAEWDYTNRKLKFYYPQGGGGTGSANDGSGTGSIPSGATTVVSNAAQPTVSINTAPAKEVQATANLLNVKCRMLVIGV